jgi:hypothetical protein
MLPDLRPAANDCGASEGVADRSEQPFQLAAGHHEVARGGLVAAATAGQIERSRGHSGALFTLRRARMRPSNAA